MEREKINRINELSKAAKERALTDEETAERAKLRAEYIAAVRGNLKSMLDNIEITDKTEERK